MSNRVTPHETIFNASSIAVQAVADECVVGGQAVQFFFAGSEFTLTPNDAIRIGSKLVQEGRLARSYATHPSKLTAPDMGDI